MQWMPWEDDKLKEYIYYDSQEIAASILPHRSHDAVRKRRKAVGAEQKIHCKKCSVPIKKHGNVRLCPSCQSDELKTVSIQTKYAEYKKNAAKRHIEWGLDMVEFAALWNSNCTYCDDTIPTIGIDRIDNNKGYVAGNVCSCCNVCNRMKAGMSPKDWFSRMKRILAFVETSKETKDGS